MQYIHISFTAHPDSDLKKDIPFSMTYLIHSLPWVINLEERWISQWEESHF